jgi:phosphate starvation-inducible PhoH-like protein
LANGTVEVAPLAYMRGRTLSRSFVILDEAQNTTLMQMKMFLTRIGEGTRAVVTGDVTQIDLPEPGASGLVRVREILHGVDGVSFVHLRDTDVVRHPLVQRIVAAFSGSDDLQSGARPPRDGS